MSQIPNLGIPTRYTSSSGPNFRPRVSLFVFTTSTGGAIFPNFCNFFRLRTSQNSMPPAAIAERNPIVMVSPMHQAGRSNRFIVHIHSAIFTCKSQEIIREVYRYLPGTVRKKEDYDPIHQGAFGYAMDVPSSMDL